MDPRMQNADRSARTVRSISDMRVRPKNTPAKPSAPFGKNTPNRVRVWRVCKGCFERAGNGLPIAGDITGFAQVGESFDEPLADACQ